MHMEENRKNEVLRKALEAHLMELLLFPMLLYSYREGGFIHWIVLILVDDYIMKRNDFFSMMEIYRSDPKNSWFRHLLILEGFMAVGLVVVAFKNWHVALLLLGNDLLLDFLSIFTREKQKHDKQE